MATEPVSGSSICFKLTFAHFLAREEGLRRWVTGAATEVRPPEPVVP